MIVKGIRQFGTWDFYSAVNNLSFVTKWKNEKNIWCWNIDLSKINEDEINHKLSSFSQDDVAHFRNLIKKLLRDSVPQKVQEKPASYAAKPATDSSNKQADSFHDFIQKLEQNIKLESSTTYIVTGDIVNGHRGGNNGALFFTLLDEHNIYQTIQLLVPEKLQTNGLGLDTLNDTRVKVSGKVKFYSKSANIMMTAESIEILSECSREIEYKKSEQSCKSFLRTVKEQKNFSIDNITDIGLITGGSEKHPIRGAIDFTNHLTRLLKKEERLHTEYVKISDVKDILSALQRLNEEGKCQVIAIIRGGGPAESLACYSDPELVKAIYKSPIPVVTGIGHYSDLLLCEQAARFNGGTPTGAANFINRQYYRQYNQQRNHYHAKTEYARILAEYQKELSEHTKEDLLIKSENLQTELQLAERENQRLQQELNSIKHRNLISRIFNWG